MKDKTKVFTLWLHNIVGQLLLIVHCTCLNHFKNKWNVWLSEFVCVCVFVRVYVCEFVCLFLLVICIIGLDGIFAVAAMDNWMEFPYSYKFSRVLILAQICAEKLNARKLIRKFTRSKEVRKNKSLRNFWKSVS